MSKDVKYIGSTPQSLSRAANELALKQFSENNKRLFHNIMKIQSNLAPIQKQFAEQKALKNIIKFQE